MMMVTRPLILIVDDDRDIRQALEDVLMDEGYEVASASNGLVAFEYLDSHPAPALILLDWIMPYCDGPTFRARQEQDRELGQIPVVLLSAHQNLETKVGELRAAGHVGKPVRLSQLLHVVENAIRH
jgi:CheY-like chemotaxis protein